VTLECATAQVFEGMAVLDLRFGFWSPDCTVCSTIGFSSAFWDLSACPGLVERAPPGSVPATGSPPVVRVEECVNFGLLVMLNQQALLGRVS
jgi:hypothetical protein